EFGGLVLEVGEIDLFDRQRHRLLGKEDAHAARIWCAAAVVKFHREPPEVIARVAANAALTKSFRPPLRFMMHKQAAISGRWAPCMTAMTSKELGISTPAEKAAAAQRRDAVKRVRWVRDRLTSTSGTPAFDYELLRQFAQNRLSASLAIWLL